MDNHILCSKHEHNTNIGMALLPMHYARARRDLLLCVAVHAVTARRDSAGGAERRLPVRVPPGHVARHAQLITAAWHG
jgi:hypothetical protein